MAKSVKEAERKPAPNPAPKPAPRPAPAPAPRPAPAPAPRPAPRPAPAPAPRPAPKPAPAPAPRPAPAPAPRAAAPAPAVSGAPSTSRATAAPAPRPAPTPAPRPQTGGSSTQINAALSTAAQAAAAAAGGTGNRAEAERLIADAYQQAVALGNAQLAADIVNSANTMWSEFSAQAGSGANDDTGPGPSGADSQGASGMSAEDIQDLIDAALAGQAGSDKVSRDRDAAAFLSDILNQYGLGELSGEVMSLVQQWGNSPSVIANNLRQTGSYKNRFKGLLALQQKGITDVRNEGDYIKLETEYRQAFREAGLQSYLGGAGSQTERDAIARLVGDYTVSVNEVKNRIADAQRVVNETAPEVRDALQRYYNVSAADLVAYTLDPTRTQDQINRKANAAIFGGLAQARGLDADVNTAESIAALSGANDLSTQNAAIQLGTARQVRDATKRLANLEATDLTDSEILQSEFSIDPEAQRKVKGLQSRERARFGGSSAAGRDTLTRTASI